MGAYRAEPMLMPIGSRFLASACLLPLLIASVDLSLGQEATGEVPFFNDEGKLTLPRDSEEELEESMPEIQLFRSHGLAFRAPDLPEL